MQDQVMFERMEQLALKEERSRRDQLEEQMFAELWQADMMAKVRNPDYNLKLNEIFTIVPFVICLGCNDSFLGYTKHF